MYTNEDTPLRLYAAVVALLAWWALVLLASSTPTPAALASVFSGDWRDALHDLDIHPVARFAALSTLGTGGLLVGCVASLAAVQASPGRLEPYSRSLAIAAAIGALFSLAWWGMEHGRASALVAPALGLAFAAEVFLLRRVGAAAVTPWLRPTWIASWGLSGALAAVLEPGIVAAIALGLFAGVLGALAGQALGQVIETVLPRPCATRATLFLTIASAIVSFGLLPQVPWGPEAIAMLAGLVAGAADVAWLVHVRRRHQREQEQLRRAFAQWRALLAAPLSGSLGGSACDARNNRQGD